MTERANQRPRLRVAEQLRVVLYLRVSKPGEKSIADQEKVGRREVAELGGVVVGVFSDKMSASRYRRVHDRPGFIKTQDYISAGGAEMLWTFASNRAARDLDDYVPLRRLCIETGTLWRYGGRTYDLSKAADRRAANADAVRAEEFGDDQSEAINRGIQEALKDGQPHGRLARGFRIVRDPVTGERLGRELIPAQAKVIRRAVDIVLAPGWDGNLSAVAREINPAWAKAGGRGVFDLRTLGKLLTNPTYAGKRTSFGEIVRDGTWDGVIDFDEHQRLVAILKAEGRKTHRGTAPTHLVSYRATCGKILEDGQRCGQGVSVKNPYTPARPNGVPTYRCPHGHVSAPVVLVEDHVEDVLLGLFERPQTAAKLAAVDETTEAAIDRELATIDELTRDRDQFVKDAARTRMSAVAVATYVEQVESDIREAKARLAALHSAADPLLTDLAGPGARGRWARYPLLRKREIIGRSLDVRILPVRGPRTLKNPGVEIYPMGSLARQ
ncbi:recombinase family protein [Nocardia brasiliensis]|uniref:recombinase family protein n=1 Tax=Nocardia brasiliensis TaxID=37326 RepID=UPI002456B569|nr:recombinase family protein [Nocardia brasiliensis]